MKMRNLVVVLLCITVIAPIVLYTDTLASFKTSSSATSDFTEDVTTFAFNSDNTRLNVLPQESSTTLKEPIGVVLSDKISKSNGDSEEESREHKSARVLSTTKVGDQSLRYNHIKQVVVTDAAVHEGIRTGIVEKPDATSEKEIGNRVSRESLEQRSQTSIENANIKHEQKSTLATTIPVKKEGTEKRSEKQIDQVLSDVRVRQLKDQLIRARVYLSLPATKINPHYTKEIHQRMKEILRVLGSATKDSELGKNSHERLKAMEETLAKGKQIQDDCAVMVKKLRAMLHSTEEQLRAHKKHTLFLTQVTAKTIPKGLHCLPLRLTTEYYAMNSSQRIFPNKEKWEDVKLYHYALFSDNVLSAGVVVNSTVTNAKNPSKHVFHIVTDRLNYAAMKMWFLVNPPGKATIQVQNIDEFTWLNSSYSPVIRQLASPSMIEYYFKTHRTNSDSNLKFRNPKYLSILNHLRFYLPEIFPKLQRVLFLDDDIVVQKDLTALWSLDLKGNVNGAVETCGENFHRFDRYLNFSNPMISKNFNPHACGWAYGMNIFDLDEWKRQNITEVYHTWQKLNHDRQLWKLGTLPPGLITFWKRVYPLERSWHVLGLGYNPNINQKEIERASVIHYNGNMKPWLEIGIPKYRNYWAKFVDYDHIYLQDCHINP